MLVRGAAGQDIVHMRIPFHRRGMYATALALFFLFAGTFFCGFDILMVSNINYKIFNMDSKQGWASRRQCANRGSHKLPLWRWKGQWP